MLFALLLIFSFQGFAQDFTKEADSLRMVLTQPNTDSARAAMHARIAYLLSDIEMEVAMAHADTAEAIGRAGGYWHAVGRAIMSRGAAYSNYGDYDSAVSVSMQAVNVAQTHHDTATLFDALNNLGIDFFYQEDHERSLQYFEQVERLAFAMKDTNRWAHALNNVGLMYGTLGDVDSEREFYARSAALFQITGEEYGYANTLLNMGTIYQGQGDYDSAMHAYESALAIYEKNHIPRAVVQVYLNIGELKIAEGRPDLGLEYLRKSEVSAREGEFLDDLSLIIRAKARAFAKLGQHDSAYAQAWVYADLEKELMNKEKLRQIQELEVEFQTEQKEREILELEQEKALASLSLARNKNRLLWLALGLVFALGVLGVVAYRNQLREKHSQALAKQNETLQALNAFKDQFVGTLAHDLKNPLSAFSSVTRSLSRYYDGLKPEEIKEYLNHLQATSENLETLLHNLLQWSLGQMHRLSTEVQPVQVAPMVSQVIGLYRLNQQMKGLSISVEVPDTLQVQADPEMLFTVLRNLVSNAIKFTPVGGQIVIRAVESGGEVSIKVNDTGIGIAEADIPLLFDEKVDPKQIGESPEKGTGLGLRLTKELLDQQQGRISIKSRLGEGSEFVITLPRAA